MFERDDNLIKTYNTKKKFSEEILLPLVDSYRKYSFQADLGATTSQEACLLSEEIRDIQRFNGLKSMCVTALNLLGAIFSTVIAKNNKEERAKILEVRKVLKRAKYIIEEEKENFFIEVSRSHAIVDTINREYFDKFKDIIDYGYSNIEILMTRNNLLNESGIDEFRSDAELQEQIKKEYIDS